MVPRLRFGSAGETSFSKSRTGRDPGPLLISCCESSLGRVWSRLVGIERKGFPGKPNRWGAIWVAICAALLVVDLVTGPPLWVHFPGIVLATLLLLEAAPLKVRGWFNLVFARGAVVVGGLALINLVTWSGYLWVMWPAGAFVFIELIRRIGVRSR